MREKEVAFTIKEVTRLGIIEAVRKGKMTNKEAASALNLSVGHKRGDVLRQYMD